MPCFLQGFAEIFLPWSRKQICSTLLWPPVRCWDMSKISQAFSMKLRQNEIFYPESSSDLKWPLWASSTFLPQELNGKGWERTGRRNYIRPRIREEGDGHMKKNRARTLLIQLNCRRHRGRSGIHVQCPLHEKPFFAPCEIPRTPVGVSKHLVYHVGSSFINEYLKILKPDENQKSWNAPQCVFRENGRSSYSHLKLTFRLLLCAWIISCSWNQRGALWRQSWLLSCSLWSLSFFSPHEDVFWKNRDEHAKSKISSLSYGIMF